MPRVAMPTNTTSASSMRALVLLTPPTILQAAAGTASPVSTLTGKTHAAMGASVTLAVPTIPEVANGTKPPILMPTINAGAESPAWRASCVLH